MQLDAGAYQRMLGEELRRLREERGLTRRDLNHRLHSDLSLQTLATYELGTRQCSVVRLVELCLALEETPEALLARVGRRYFGTFGTTEADGVRVDLRLIARAEHDDLAPFRRWAEGKLAESPAADTPHEVHLDPAALARLAELCGTTTADLRARIRRLG
ncbi:helix-turn-helix domain-containing protein [Amycolatopsis sp. NBRC 101858]|uniref:helix-turn-helix domain-containing protein n=1 Tax=Amycolatopsis sp. NBRC 101858 TaxID=3032200 RepID=UPI0025528FF1|nr:helix-turn-helix domain-containing protein [Amycolatopsis sp. NBRC 101858]